MRAAIAEGSELGRFAKPEFPAMGWAVRLPVCALAVRAAHRKNVANSGEICILTKIPQTKETAFHYLEAIRAPVEAEEERGIGKLKFVETHSARAT
jgi:hypothetical protein